MPNAIPQMSLVCEGKDYEADLLSLTVVHELGHMPYLLAVLSVTEDGTAFKPGAEVEAKTDYDGKLHPIFKGVLATVIFSMAAGTRQVTLEVRDKNDSEICTAIDSGKGLGGKDEKNTCKGWLTKSGLNVLMNEEEKSVIITTPDKQTLALNDKEGTITLKDKNGNSLVMDSNGITLKSKRDINLEATKIKLKASQSLNLKSGTSLEIAAGTALKAKSGTDAELKAGAGLTLAGSSSFKLSAPAKGEINGGGLLDVKGGMVIIN